MKKPSIKKFLDQFYAVSLGERVVDDIKSGEAKNRRERRHEKIKEKQKTLDPKKVLHDFWYGKEHE